MSVSSRCPSSTDLRDLLEGSMADSDQANVVSHLDQCGCCQQSLEALANGNSSFAVTLLEQPTHKTPEPHSAYWPALKNAEQKLMVEPPGPSKSSGEVSLAFLDPPEDGSHLGSLGNFNVVRVVGRGGMGVVLHAVDTCLQRDVAIKVLDPELSEDELAVTRFCREARAAASISHENVVAVHHVERDEGKDLPFLVMELITGESLEKRLEREGRLSLKEIVSIGMQVAAGLAAAHEKGLIHRDIKPGNILMEKTGQRVKLTDFGLAQAVEDVRLTRSGSGGRHAPLHVAGASQRRGTRCPFGPLQPRRAALRAVHGPHAVRGQNASGGDEKADRGEAHPHPRAAARCAGLAR